MALGSSSWDPRTGTAAYPDGACRTRESYDERVEWVSRLTWRPENDLDLSLAALDLMEKARELGINPKLLVVGQTDFAWAQGIANIHVLELQVGDFPDDQRWYVEDCFGKRLGSP